MAQLQLKNNSPLVRKMGIRGVFATCKEKAVCIVCGEEYGEIDTTNHIGETSIRNSKAATCVEEGYTGDVYCNSCEQRIECGEIIPALGHTYSNEWIIDKEATCTEAGSKERTCDVCGEKETAQIPATGHTETKDEAVAPTCEEDGKTEGIHCSVCGKVIKKQEAIAASGHTWSNWRVSKKATCTETGIKERQCNICGEKETVQISSLGHDYSKEWTVDKDASCTEVGSKSHHCIICGDKGDITEIKASGHEWSSWKTSVSATYDRTGIEVRTCKICGEKETKHIEKLQRTSISKANISGISSKNYSGKARVQSGIIVKIGTKTLKQNTDYVVSYKNNINIGTATIKVTGKGAYTGSLEKNFKITVTKGNTYTVGTIKYKITNSKTDGKGTVSVVGTTKSKKSMTSVTIAQSVKIGGKTFKITSIGDGAFNGYTKLTTVTIKSMDITSIGNKAFTNIKKTASIKVPTKKYSAYKKLLKTNTGFKDTMKIKKI